MSYLLGEKKYPFLVWCTGCKIHYTAQLSSAEVNDVYNGILIIKCNKCGKALVPVEIERPIDNNGDSHARETA